MLPTYCGLGFELRAWVSLWRFESNGSMCQSILDFRYFDLAEYKFEILDLVAVLNRGAKIAV
ncbi:hypothetical protein IQ270_14180 [Microcoleus sp. LEGE 07076]|uniref:hypothetical protein n=1 Tax=Microcoleus sp. LEGE 07076 TaxID=915322 RepID=UPI00188160E8|nr:hypothetical protein [Microcoleus sp. LEGE 07076]MBE9185814.1 hypothetical protein [Microcoleus sp. LEGE 07076]